MKEDLTQWIRFAITPMSEPTERVSQMVVVKKKDDSVHICIDPTELNKALKRL